MKLLPESRVSISDVLVERCLLSTSVGTHRTGVGFFSGMDVIVPPEVCLVFENFATHGANVLPLHRPDIVYRRQQTRGVHFTTERSVVGRDESNRATHSWLLRRNHLETKGQVVNQTATTRRNCPQDIATFCHRNELGIYASERKTSMQERKSEKLQ